MKYNEILTSSGKFRIELGLDRIKAILNLLGNPQKKCKFIHIAGTNGKGSTSKIINDILIEHFKNSAKIGLFTSPHMFSYCERIKINNKNILEVELDNLIQKINNLAIKNNIDLTEFELICAATFYYFAKNNVDYVVLEVGLGGLYDATNVIEPLVSVITTIDLDHTQRLGNTIDEIAFQKAGIIKQNSMVVVSKNNLGFNVISKEAKKKNSKLIIPPEIKIEFEDFNNNYAIIDKEKYKFNLLGTHQKDNLSLALSAVKALNLDIKKETIESALKKITWDFRLQYVKEKNLLIDGAHNPNGILALKNFIDENLKNYPKKIIFGCLNNKDYSKMLDILLEKEEEFFFFEFNYPNALKYDELPKKYKNMARPLSNIEEVRNIINDNSFLKIVCGSLYMSGIIFKDFNLS